MKKAHPCVVPKIIGIKSGGSIWRQDLQKIIRLKKPESNYSSLFFPQSAFRNPKLRMPMAGLEPARAFYGPTDFKSVLLLGNESQLPFCCHFWSVKTIPDVKTLKRNGEGARTFAAFFFRLKSHFGFCP